MTKNKLYIVSSLLLSFCLSTSLFAQCGSVVKAGIKKLAPYTYNDQINSVKLEAGQPANFHLSFYKGVSYKIQLATGSDLGKVNFRVLDENNTEVYNSSKDNSDNWSFFSNSTQELVIELLPQDKTAKGCAAIVIGMQVAKSNSIRDL